MYSGELLCLSVFLSVPVCLSCVCLSVSVYLPRCGREKKLKQTSFFPNLFLFLSSSLLLSESTVNETAARKSSDLSFLLFNLFLNFWSCTREVHIRPSIRPLVCRPARPSVRNTLFKTLSSFIFLAV